MNFKNNYKISVIGLGYVGLPLACELGRKYSVIGVDLNLNRVINLKKKIDINQEVTKNELKNAKYLHITNNHKLAKECNVHIVTVPTPLKNKTNIPDLSYLKKACEMVSKNLKKKDIIIFESTSYPGTSEEFCVPIIEKNSKFKYKKDFFVGYSPERINPGDKKHSLVNSAKIVSACDSSTLNKI